MFSEQVLYICITLVAQDFLRILNVPLHIHTSLITKLSKSFSQNWNRQIMSFIHKNKTALIFDPYWVIWFEVHIFKIFAMLFYQRSLLIGFQKCNCNRTVSVAEMLKGGSLTKICCTIEFNFVFMAANFPK